MLSDIYSERHNNSFNPTRASETLMLKIGWFLLSCVLGAGSVGLIRALGR